MLGTISVASSNCAKLLSRRAIISDKLQRQGWEGCHRAIISDKLQRRGWEGCLRGDSLGRTGGQEQERDRGRLLVPALLLYIKHKTQDTRYTTQNHIAGQDQERERGSIIVPALLLHMKDETKLNLGKLCESGGTGEYG